MIKGEIIDYVPDDDDPYAILGQDGSTRAPSMPSKETQGTVMGK